MCNINILQFNVRGIISLDEQQMKCKCIYDQLVSKKTDVVLLQEWCATVREQIGDESVPTSNPQHQMIPRFPIEFFPGYKVHFTSTECAILYQEDLSTTPLQYNDKYHCYPHRNNFHVCGVILHAPKTDYSIYSVYRPQTADPTQLFTFPFQTDHVIIGGDFNLHHPLWGSLKCSTKSTEFVNHLTESQLQLVNSKTPTREDPSNQKHSCIDLTLVTPNIHKKDWFVNQASYRKCISDHYEIYFTISLDDSTDDIFHSTWNLSSNNKWKKFRSELRKQIANYSKSRPKETEQQATQLSNIIYKTAVYTLGFRKYHLGLKPWWNSNINKLKKRCKQLRRKIEKIRKKYPFSYKNHPNYTQLKIQYDDKQKLKTHAIHHAKQRYNTKINKHIQTSKLDDKLSWRILNQHKTTNQSHNIPPLKYKGQIHYNTSKQAEILHETLTNPPPPKYNASHVRFHNKIHKLSSSIMYDDNNVNNDDLLNKEIQKYEILNCIAALDPDKAIGPDKIHNKMIIQTKEILIDELQILFNNCMKDGIYPQVWNYSNIHPIPKPHKLHCNPSNYGPIAVSSCLGKVFEKLLAKRLQHFCKVKQIFNNNQCGFQINRCTDDILSTFLNDAYSCLDYNSDMDCVFTDFSKAYDSIWHEGLMVKLHSLYGISGKFLQCINHFLRNRNTRVLLKKGKSTWKIQGLGLPQGSSLSPILYIYIRMTIRLIYKLCLYGCFADDTAFWTKPATQNMLRYKILQKELNRFLDWTKYWKLSLNASKCTSLNIHKPKSKNIHHKYLLNNTELTTIEQCKYLGLWLDKHLHFNTHIDKSYAKLQGSLYRTYNLLKTGIKLHPKTIIQIYKCKARPIVEYACIFYLHKDKNNRIQKLQNRFLRCAYPCRSSTNVQMLHMIADVKPLSIRLNHLLLRHWCRAKYLPQSHPLNKTLRNFQTNYNKIIQQNNNVNKYIHHSPLYRAEYIVDSKYPLSISSITNVIQNPITALPCYTLKSIPTNYSVSLIPVKKSQINEYAINFYTDGSCNPNPGMGAYGWFSPSITPNDRYSNIQRIRINK